MTKLPVISSKEVIKALRAAGFEDAPRRGKGSHSALVRRGPDKSRLVIVPDRKTLPRGTLRATGRKAIMLRQTGKNEILAACFLLPLNEVI